MQPDAGVSAGAAASAARAAAEDRRCAPPGLQGTIHTCPHAHAHSPPWPPTPKHTRTPPPTTTSREWRRARRPQACGGGRAGEGLGEPISPLRAGAVGRAPVPQPHAAAQQVQRRSQGEPGHASARSVRARLAERVHKPLAPPLTAQPHTRATAERAWQPASTPSPPPLPAPQHVLVVTRRFESQADPLNANDLAATLQVVVLEGCWWGTRCSCVRVLPGLLLAACTRLPEPRSMIKL